METSLAVLLESGHDECQSSNTNTRVANGLTAPWQAGSSAKNLRVAHLTLHEKRVGEAALSEDLKQSQAQNRQSTGGLVGGDAPLFPKRFSFLRGGQSVLKESRNDTWTMDLCMMLTLRCCSLRGVQWEREKYNEKVIHAY